MIKKSNNETIIYIGEIFISTKPEIISTTLGSCVAVCLKDFETGIAGMNHYLLPTELNERVTPTDSVFGDTSYADISLPKMLNEMIKKGANKKNIQAKIFGGGNLMKVKSELNTKVSIKNIEFAQNFLKSENIYLLNEDVGGKYGRQISFHTESFKVIVKKLQNKIINYG